MASEHQLPHNSSLATLRVDEIGVTSSFTRVEELTPLRTEKIGDFQQFQNNSFSRRPLGRRQRHPAFDVMRWLCAILHLALIAVLVYLIARPVPHGQTRFSGMMFFLTPSFSIDDTSEALNGYTKSGIGYIVTAVGVLLTLTTQRLALRRQLHLYNTLTAKHDANSAWMSVGSAAMTLLQWRDIGLKASLSSTVFPLLYLGSLAALHSVATSMVSLVPFALNQTIYFQSNGLPDFSNTSIDNAFTGSSALLTILSLDNFDFTGLGSNGLGVIYDIPTNRTTVRRLPIDAVNVNGTYFNVTCGTLDGRITSNTNGYSLLINDDPQLALQIPTIFSQNALAIRPAPWGGEADEGSDLLYWPSTIVVLSTVPIQDSLNHTAQSLSVNPPMSYTPFNSSVTEETTEISALGCNLTMQSLPHALIDSATFALIDSTATNKTSATLTAFPVESRSTLLNLSDPEDALTFAWGVLPTAAVSPLVFSLQNQCFGSNNSFCEPLYEAEQFAMESLNIFPDLLLGQRPSASNITLVDLENVLSRMSAIEIWAESQGNNQKFANALSLEGQEDSANTNKSFVVNDNRVDYFQFVLVFGIYRSQLFVALALSIFLLVLAAPSILDNNNLKIDSIGLLQMVYLINRHPELHQSIVNIDDPSAATLRKEGNKQPVCFDDETRQRRGLGDISNAPC